MTQARLDRVDAPLLVVEDVVVHHRLRDGQMLEAVAGVSFEVARGETVGLVGESGCGKTSLGRAVMQLPPPTSGRIRLDGVTLGTMSRRELRRQRTKFQMVMQNPLASLNPRRTVLDSVAEPLRAQGERDHVVERAREAIADVELDPDVFGDRLPGALSGGQRQRVSIARALVTAPSLLICDEPVSALDVSVQAHVLNLLEDLKGRFSLAMVFVAHDLAVVLNVSDRVAVMYLGKICEVGPSAELGVQPAHPYTRLLLDSIPRIEVDGAHADAPVAPPSEPPSPLAPPSGCRFRTRCPVASARCASEEPVLRTIGAGREVACHHPLGNGMSDPPPAGR